MHLETPVIDLEPLEIRIGIKETKWICREDNIRGKREQCPNKALGSQVCYRNGF